MPHAAPGEAAECLRCETVLLRGRRDSLGHATAYAVAAASAMVLALTLPFLGLYVLGRGYSSSLFTGPIALARDGLGELAALVVFTAIAMPVLKLVILLTTLLGLRMAQPPPSLARVFAWYDAVSPWAMIEVFLLGSFVAYTRLAALATVQVGPACMPWAASCSPPPPPTPCWCPRRCGRRSTDAAWAARRSRTGAR